ncbi:MAG: hypothetical protein OEW75_02355 [Cyclobacteriaceae bacterium]|nr:hypothetical protein [Cyclobacteriaceae bacterium]
MTNGFKLAFIFLLFSNFIFGQVDSIKRQIMQYEESKSIIISKGRNLLLDKFIEGDLQKVKEVKDYLVQIEDENYFAFYPAEYWFILYWTGDYVELAEDIRNFDPDRFESYNTKIRPSNDMLYNKLNEKSFENESQIKNQIQTSNLDSETKEVIILNLEWLLLGIRNDVYAQDSLNHQADIFLKIYTPSEFEGFVKNQVRYKEVPKDWGMTFEFFTGYSIYTGNLSENYSNNVPIGVAFDICYKKFELYLRDYIGFNETRKDFNYSLGIWEKGSEIVVFLPEASLGYVVYNDNRYKLSPFAGIGSMDISPPTSDTKDIPELKEISLEFTTTYIAGFNLDIKLGAKHTPEYRPKTSYGFIRVRYGYSMPGFEKKYNGMSGNMHYITVGFGGMARGVGREY